MSATAVPHQVETLSDWVKLILDNLLEAVVVADKHGDIIFASKPARELVDFEAQSLHMHFPILTYLDGSRVPDEEYPIKRSLRGEEVPESEYLVQTKDGSKRNMIISGRLIRKEGKPHLVVVMCCDITNVREFGDRDLDYVRAVSHDLRNPLGTLLAQAQLLELDLAQKGLKDEAKAVERILKNGRRMNAMIDDFMESLKLGAGLVRLRLEKVDLREFTLGVAERFRNGKRDPPISVLLPDGPCLVTIDPERIERCLENLIANAIRYSPSGLPVTITLKTGCGKADISVQDHGCGIPPENLPRIFDRFYRASALNSDGLGLGLYITRLITEAHGGTVSVESQVGVGSTFVLSLPLR